MKPDKLTKVTSDLTEVKHDGSIALKIDIILLQKVAFYILLVIGAFLLAMDGALVIELLKALFIGWVLREKYSDDDGN